MYAPQPPLYFFLGVLLYTYPDVAKVLAAIYLGLVLYRCAR